MNDAAKIARIANERRDFLQMRETAERALLRGGIEWIADTQDARARRQALDERLNDRFVHEHARAAEADLALIGKAGAHGRFHRQRDVRIFEDNQRIFAAE